jgi:hypothetical protein
VQLTIVGSRWRRLDAANGSQSARTALLPSGWSYVVSRRPLMPLTGGGSDVVTLDITTHREDHRRAATPDRGPHRAATDRSLRGSSPLAASATSTPSPPTAASRAPLSTPPAYPSRRSSNAAATSCGTPELSPTPATPGSTGSSNKCAGSSNACPPRNSRTPIRPPSASRPSRGQRPSTKSSGCVPSPRTQTTSTPCQPHAVEPSRKPSPDFLCVLGECTSPWHR